MNKTRYRIIFSKARGMLIAVAETVKSQGKQKGQSRGGAETTITTNGSSSASSYNWVEKTLISAMSLTMALGPTYVQAATSTKSIVVADANAGANKPTVFAGTNSAGRPVPVVWIQAPTAAGISRNVYTQFDVLQDGAVLNNSAGAINSTLAGDIRGNDKLGLEGSARVIVNEVNSTAPTRFEGNLEVAGGKADVVIANPMGISVKGAGFINVNKATLTTGTPIYKDGNLDSFRVTQGTVTVDAGEGTSGGLGASADDNRANYVDILARAVEINSAINGKRILNVVTGANTISADLAEITTRGGTGDIPAVKLDVSALGSMYANNIYLIGTEAGLGVRNAGTIKANNNLVVTTAGRIENSGTLIAVAKESTGGPGVLSLTTTEQRLTASYGDIYNTGTIAAASLLSIDASRDLNNNGGTIRVSTNTAPLIISTGRTLNIRDNSTVTNISEDGDIYLDVGNNFYQLANSTISAKGAISLNAGAGITQYQTGTVIEAQKDISLTSINNISLAGALSSVAGGVTLQASRPVAADQTEASSASVSLGNSAISAANGLTVYADKDVMINPASLAAGSIAAYGGNNLTWNQASNTNYPVVTGDIRLQAKNILSLEGGSSGNKALTTTAGSLSLAGGTLVVKDIKLTAEKNIELYADTGDMLVSKSPIVANTGNVNITSLAGRLVAEGLQVDAAAGKASIMASKDVSLKNVSVEKIETVNEKQITPSGSVVNALKGVYIGAVGDGSITSGRLNLSATGGDIRIVATKDISLYVDKEYITDIYYGQSTTRESLERSSLKARGINIQSKEGPITIYNGDLKANNAGLSITSGDALTLKNVTTYSRRNSILSSAGDQKLSLNGVTATSREHMAISSNGQLHVNSLNDAGVFDWSPTTKTKLTADGVLSLVSRFAQKHQNTEYTAGAILVESGSSLDWKGSHSWSANKSEGRALFTKNDTQDLTEVYNDLSIQSRSHLTIDPNEMTLVGLGDITLRSTEGVLSLLGYEGKSGNGSEKVVNLATNTGSINLLGAAVNLEGTNVSAKKDVNIISSASNISITPIKNLYTVYSKAQVDAAKKKLSDAITLKEDMKYAAANLCAPGVEFYCYSPAMFERVQEDIDQFTQEVADFQAPNKNVTFALARINAEKDVNIYAKGGVLIAGANISAFTNDMAIPGMDGPTININASGKLPAPQHNFAKTEENKHLFLPTAIQITSVAEQWQRGEEASDTFSQHYYVKPTTLLARNINIKASDSATSASAASRIVINAAELNAYDFGKINISGMGDVDLEHTQENYFDKETSRWTKRGSWGRKKTYTQTTTTIEQKATPVKLNAGTITINAGDNFNAYGTSFNASPLRAYNFIYQQMAPIYDSLRSIAITAGDKANFYAVDESYTTDVNTVKKSSWVGIKYNTTKYNDTRYLFEPLPAELIGNGVDIKSGGDTRLQATIFKTMSGATITAGFGDKAKADAKIIFEGVKRREDLSHTEESNSVVWQKQAGQGSSTETLLLPRFEGPVAPVFSAPGGFVADIPAGNFKTELSKLVNQPGYEYLNTLKASKNIKWNEVSLAYDNWNYSQQGLTGAGAALIIIIVTILTMGTGTAAATAAGATTGSTATVGLGASMLGPAGITATVGATGATVIVPSALGAMANAAVTAIATQASISMINNGGNIKATLQELGSKESVKSLATAVATAGVLSQIGEVSQIKEFASDNFQSQFMRGLVNRTGHALVSSTVSAGVGTAINGGSLSDNLQDALLSGVASSLQASLAEQIGISLDVQNKDFIDQLLHKVAHAAAGCVTSAIQKQCEAGAIGAVVAEMVAGTFTKPEGVSDAEQAAFDRKVVNTTKLISGSVAALAGYDVATAAAAAENAVTNNYLTSDNYKALRKTYEGCRSKGIEKNECVGELMTQATKWNDENDTSLKVACVSPDSKACNDHLKAMLEGERTREALNKTLSIFDNSLFGKFNNYGKFSNDNSTLSKNIYSKARLYDALLQIANWKNVNCPKLNNADCVAMYQAHLQREGQTRIDIAVGLDHAKIIPGVSWANAALEFATGMSITDPDTDTSFKDLLTIFTGGKVRDKNYSIVENAYNKARLGLGHRYETSPLSENKDIAVDVASVREYLAANPKLLKSGYTADGLSVVAARIDSIHGTEYVLAVNGLGWHPASPDRITINGINYKVIRTDSASVQPIDMSTITPDSNRSNFNYNHADNKVYSYIKDKYLYTPTQVTMGIQNTSDNQDSAGMCEGCTMNSIYFSKEMAFMSKLSIFHGSTKF